jgi:gluconate 2-dehydrogenase gamma chain
MAGQSIERREMLRYIAMASVAATFPGFRQWTFACSHGPHPPGALPQASGRPYRPLFLSPQNFRLVEHLVEMIIPADDTPGAREAGVAEFIDFMLANRVAVSADEDTRTVDEKLRLGAQAQVQFTSGLSWLNAHCESEHRRSFMDCSAEQQIDVLEQLAYKSKFRPAAEGGPGREFFQLLRDYTVAGYYTSKIGLESLGYPGLRTAWPKMPGCSHPEDRQHAHLEAGSENIVKTSQLVIPTAPEGADHGS